MLKIAGRTPLEDVPVPEAWLEAWYCLSCAKTLILITRSLESFD